MADITNIFGGKPFKPTKTERHVDPPDVQIADAMQRAGVAIVPPDIQIDGTLHRFNTNTRKGNKKDGWYIFYPEEPVAGAFGCWRDDISGIFTADIGKQLTPAQQLNNKRRILEAKARRDEERQKRQEVTTDTVQIIWENAAAASPEHPYLTRKGIQPNGARVTGDGRLVVPLYKDGTLTTLQYIDGEKKIYHTGGGSGDAWWMLGDVDGLIYVAEGFATAATIHEESGQACAVAYSASSLVPCVAALRDRYPSEQIVICADNDHGGVGRKYADQAAAKYGCRVVMPPEVDTDANDYRLSGGDLMALLAPPASDWLVSADDFSSQPAPIKWLVKHWLQQDALIMVHGPSGGGKTFVVLDWCMHMAASLTDWHGHKAKAANVVYLAGEGHHGLRGRVAVWRQEKRASLPGMFISKSGCDLNTPTGYHHAADAIKQLPTPPDLIVIDTLHRFLDGDENSAQDAKTMLDACAALMAEFSCSVLLVHHTGVSEEAQHRARGSSAWKGALDIEISVIPGKEGGPLELKQRKSKDAEEAEPMFFDLTSTAIKGWYDEDGEAVTSCVITPGEAPAPKADNKLSRHKTIFQRAWVAAGREVEIDKPWLSSETLAAYLEAKGYAEKTVKNYLKPSCSNGTIGALVDANAIEKSGRGWAVIDGTWASAMALIG